jgi:hypothetical protein
MNIRFRTACLLSVLVGAAMFVVGDRHGRAVQSLTDNAEFQQALGLPTPPPLNPSSSDRFTF